MTIQIKNLDVRKLFLLLEVQQYVYNGEIDLEYPGGENFGTWPIQQNPIT